MPPAGLAATARCPGGYGIRPYAVGVDACIDPPACRESAFYLCYRIFVGGGVLDAPRGAAKK